MSDHIDKSSEADQNNNNILSPRVFKQLFTPEECNRIIDMKDTFSFGEGKLTGSGEHKAVDMYIRSSKVRFIYNQSDAAWVYEKINDAVSYMNQYYRFDLTDFGGMQVAQYPVGGHYNWHIDIGLDDSSRRKLSLSVQLSDPASYDGGELIFNRYTLDSKGVFAGQGSAIIFPSYLAHRVSVVTKGVRWSLVSWILGPPFR